MQADIGVGVVETYVVRTAIAATVTLALFPPRDVPCRAPRAGVRSLLITLSWVLLILGIQHGSPVVVQTLVATTPLFVLAVESWRSRQRPPARVLGAALWSSRAWHSSSPAETRDALPPRLVTIQPDGTMGTGHEDHGWRHEEATHGARALLLPHLPGHGGRVRPSTPGGVARVQAAIRESGFRTMTGFRRGTDVWYYGEVETDRETAFTAYGDQDIVRKWGSTSPPSS